jgi:hypothetical protein
MSPTDQVRQYLWLFLASSFQDFTKKREDIRVRQTPIYIHGTAYLKISAALPYVPCSSSRARYSLSPSRSNAPPGRGHTDAIPKSPILKRPSRVRNMLAGFRSRWIISASWIKRRPCRHASYQYHISKKQSYQAKRKRECGGGGWRSLPNR